MLFLFMAVSGKRLLPSWKIAGFLSDLPDHVGFSRLHDAENFLFTDQVEIVLDHQFHDTGSDGKVDEFLWGELMYQAVDECARKGIPGTDSFQTVYGVDGTFIKMSIF